MLRKNVAGQFIHIAGVNPATGAITTGATWTMRRCLDGVFAAGGATITEDGTTGFYKVAFTQADTNGNDNGYFFTATNCVPVTVNVVTTAADPTDTVRFGLTALPNAAAEAAGGLYTRGTGAGQIKQDANGRVDMNLKAILDTTLTETAGQMAAGFKKVFDVAAPVFTAASVNQTGDNFARIGAPAGASVSADIAAVKVDTAAIKAKTDNLPSDPADASDIAGAFSTVSTTLATIAGYIDTEVAAIKAKTDNLPSDPADASDIAAAFATVNTKLDAIDTSVDDLPTNAELATALGTADDAVLAALAAGVDANLISINGATEPVDRMERALDTEVLVTVGTGSTTTSIVASSVSGSATASQFVGLIMKFPRDTTTANLRGQGTRITAYDHATLTFTVAALTDAPVSGDTPIVV